MFDFFFLTLTGRLLDLGKRDWDQSNSKWAHIFIKFSTCARGLGRFPPLTGTNCCHKRRWLHHYLRDTEYVLPVYGFSGQDHNLRFTLLCDQNRKDNQSTSTLWTWPSHQSRCNLCRPTNSYSTIEHWEWQTFESHRTKRKLHGKRRRLLFFTVQLNSDMVSIQSSEKLY